MSNTSTYAVILAGGAGTRFWPLSRQKQPKQFLKMVGGKSLLAHTMARIQGTIPSKNIFIITNKNYGNLVRKETGRLGIPARNVLLEPTGKNTAPSIAWAAFVIKQMNPRAVMVVLPSDHLIVNKKGFLKNLAQAVSAAQKRKLVTFGITPTHPETGYGYIKITETFKSNQIFPVEKFIEKPSLPKAENFLRTKKYLWNSGMFVWRADVILEEFKKRLPRIYYFLKNHHAQSKIKRVWTKLESISIDYGILEKAKNMAVVCCPNLGWSDLGSWQALFDTLPKKGGNFFKGDVITLDNQKTMILGNKRLVVGIGLKDTIVIDADDCLLICRKDLSQKVKDIVGVLKKTGRQRYL